MNTSTSGALSGGQLEALPIEEDPDEVDPVGAGPSVEVIDDPLEIRRLQERRREHAVAAGRRDRRRQLGVSYDASHRRALDRQPAADEIAEGRR